MNKFIPKNSIAVAFFALLISFNPVWENIANAVSDTATATMNVLTTLAISQISNLVFADAEASAAAEVVAPGSAEDASNASFDVAGEASTAYTITLPADSTVVMTTGGGGANETIDVDSFVSNPAAGANGSLDGTGAETIYVGATRAALSATQVVGPYTDTFTVDVVY